MRLRVYTDKGKERWMSAGTIVPAGWYDEKGQIIKKESVVVLNIFRSDNPYDQGPVRYEKSLSLKERV